MNYVAQLIGFIAFIFFVTSIYSKKKKSVLICQLMANLLYGIEYILLNTITAGILNLIAVLRCFIYYKYEEKNRKIPISILLGYIIIVVVISIVTLNGWLTIIPMIIGIIYSYATWQSNPKFLTTCFLVCGTTWFFYNLYVGAYTAVLGNVVDVISSIIVLKSYKKKKV